jgi:hypothetical protein
VTSWINDPLLVIVGVVVIAAAFSLYRYFQNKKNEDPAQHLCSDSRGFHRFRVEGNPDVVQKGGHRINTYQAALLFEKGNKTWTRIVSRDEIDIDDKFQACLDDAPIQWSLSASRQAVAAKVLSDWKAVADELYSSQKRLYDEDVEKNGEEATIPAPDRQTAFNEASKVILLRVAKYQEDAEQYKSMWRKAESDYEVSNAKYMEHVRHCRGEKAEFMDALKDAVKAGTSKQSSNYPKGGR